MFRKKHSIRFFIGDSYEFTECPKRITIFTASDIDLLDEYPALGWVGKSKIVD